MPAVGLVASVRAVRCGLRVRGTVQGVGLRPAVYRLATELQLAGLVRNEVGSVWIEVEGSEPAVQAFLTRLPSAIPAAARVDDVESTVQPSRAETTFRIEDSVVSSGASAELPPDLSPCSDCLRELGDPSDRRYRYPFINCTACGPRFTIVRDTPYDRSRTTMETFAMCEACRHEYDNPLDRRFHAEPIACPACGPALAVLDGDPRGEAALQVALDRLHREEILALKGVGGFLLAADATSETAVQRLRLRKRRPHKPLAVMARDLEHARRIAHIDDDAARALTDPARPIVVVAICEDGPLAPSVAPGLSEVGVFLPPSALQHLLLQDGPPWQVMTSGNASGEPIARTSEEARARLSGIADLILTHDRDIHTRADDSVVRVVAGAPTPLRRARGYVPTPVVLPVQGPPVLAVGGQDKSVVCVTFGGRALLSHHLGRLDHPDAYAQFQEAIDRIVDRSGSRPEWVAHDLHPDYRSTQWALQCGLPPLPVQHHHAHIAACMVEHRRTEPVIGVAFDGTGLGTDGSAWGGELFVADLCGFQRVGCLPSLALPGGEMAIRQPWRLAAAALHHAGEPLEVPGWADDPARSRQLQRVGALLHKPSVPRAHGAGRWFDAVAALCGLTEVVSYDGQAAMELEAVAGGRPERPYDFEVSGEPLRIELASTIRQIAQDRRRGEAVARIAARFHETLAGVVHVACTRLRDAGAPSTVALSGGCFQNRRLTERCLALLQDAGFEVLLHRQVPSSDGGLCLGQAAVATATLTSQQYTTGREVKACASGFRAK